MSRIKMLSVLAVLMLVGLAAGCKSTEEPQEQDLVLKPGQTAITGTVIHVDLEGGFYGIESDEGRKYFPLNLDDAFKEDGLRVQFTARMRKDVMTIVMWGETCEILTIQPL